MTVIAFGELHIIDCTNGKCIIYESIITYAIAICEVSAKSHTQCQTL